MKKLKWLLTAVLTVCCIILLAGCGNGLSRPSDLKVDETTLTLSWSPVENATTYVIDIGGRQYVSRKASYSLTGLADGDYRIKVKATDATKKYNDSSWSDTLEYTKEYDSGFTYTLTNGNTEYELTRAGSAQGDVVIDDTYRGLPVTSIAPRAFYSNYRIRSVTIGKNVKTIGEYAFTNCSQLTEVNFPENGVTDIGAYAFQGCQGLSSVTLPNSLKVLKDYTFRYCRHLISVTFGSSLEAINIGVFSGCNVLASVNITDGVKSIGESAFSGCIKLETVALGSGVETLGNSAFVGCTELTSVTGGSSLRTIGERAFEGCEKLNNVTLSGTVSEIGAGAFYGCTDLNKISLGSGVTIIGSNAFYGTGIVAADKAVDGLLYADDWVVGCVSLSSNGSPDFKEGTVGIAQNAFRGIEELQEVVIPDTVKYIGDYAFAECKRLVGLDIGNGVIQIGRYAFANCELLGRRYVSLGSSVEEIGSYAFQGCSNFGDPAYMGNNVITIPQSVEIIGTYAFRNTYYWRSITSGIVYVDKWAVGYLSNSDQTSITIQEGTVGISNYAFYNSNVTSVTIPGSVKLIGSSAFNGCSQLGYVFFNEMVTWSELEEISDYAFYKCEKLLGIDLPVTVKRIGRSAFYKTGITEIEIPAAVEEIDQYAFYSCKNLNKINFKGNSRLTTVGANAFNSCSALPSITLPDGVTYIGSKAFYRCTALLEINLGGRLSYLGDNAFNGCTMLERIVLPDTLTEINEKTFYRCSALASVTFGNGVTYIGNYAFYACTAITEMDIPKTVTELGNYAFRGCTGLTSIILRGSVETVGSHVFNGCRFLTIYTDCAERAEGWNGRWNSGYRPVIWGCTLSADSGYVVSFVKDEGTISYPTAVNGISAPEREGYLFGGWSATVDGEEVIISMENITEVPDGTVLTAIWVPVGQDTSDAAQA